MNTPNCQFEDLDPPHGTLMALREKFTKFGFLGVVRHYNRRTGMWVVVTSGGVLRRVSVWSMLFRGFRLPEDPRMTRLLKKSMRTARPKPAPLPEVEPPAAPAPVAQPYLPCQCGHDCSWHNYPDEPCWGQVYMVDEDPDGNQFHACEGHSETLDWCGGSPTARKYIPEIIP